MVSRLIENEHLVIGCEHKEEKEVSTSKDSYQEPVADVETPVSTDAPETQEAIEKAKDTTIDLAEKAVAALKDWLKQEDK